MVIVMALNYTFKNISAEVSLFMKKTIVHGANHQPASSYWQILSHNVVSTTHRH